MGWYNPDKLQLSNVYRVIRGARGFGRIRAAAQRYGYDQLILQALRIKLRHPLGCPDIDRWINWIMMDREIEKWDLHWDLHCKQITAVTLRK